MSRDYPQFKLRLPPELRARINEAAAGNHRSVNAEIVARIQQSFGYGATATADTPAQRALHAADQAESAILALKAELFRLERDGSSE